MKKQEARSKSTAAGPWWGELEKDSTQSQEQEPSQEKGVKENPQEKAWEEICSAAMGTPRTGEWLGDGENRLH